MPTDPLQPRTPQVPLDAVAGRPADEVAQLYRDDSFQVQVVDLDTDPVVTLDYRVDRIRVFCRDGVVDHASQG